MCLYSIVDHSEREVVRLSYRLKNLKEKNARHTNHLTFLIIPRGLRIKLPVKSARADRIAIRTRFALLRERVHKVRYVRKMAREEIAVVSEKLKVSVNEDR